MTKRDLIRKLLIGGVVKDMGMSKRERIHSMIYAGVKGCQMMGIPMFEIGVALLEITASFCVNNDIRGPELAFKTALKVARAEKRKIEGGISGR